jgi:hypothetical protein
MAATYLLTLYPASLGAFGMTATTVRALLMHTNYRYSIKDDSGEKLLTFPYDPKQVIKGKEIEVGIAFRTYRAYENSKEWTAITLPFVFCMSLYGSSIPYVTERMNRGVVGITSLGWCVGNFMYCSGYKSSNEERMPGFKIRTLCARIFMYGSCAGLLCYGGKKLIN